MEIAKEIIESWENFCNNQRGVTLTPEKWLQSDEAKAIIGRMGNKEEAYESESSEIESFRHISRFVVEKGNDRLVLGDYSIAEVVNLIYDYIHHDGLKSVFVQLKDMENDNPASGIRVSDDSKYYVGGVGSRVVSPDDYTFHNIEGIKVDYHRRPLTIINELMPEIDMSKVDFKLKTYPTMDELNDPFAEKGKIPKRTVVVSDTWNSPMHIGATNAITLTFSDGISKMKFPDIKAAIERVINGDMIMSENESRGHIIRQHNKIIELENSCKYLSEMIDHYKKNIQCTCLDDEKHGETSIMCCNECGLPTEKFWGRQI